jgi:nitrite transporter NirC
MYLDTVQAIADQAASKLTGQRRSLASHLVRSMLAGMYVGACIVLIFIVGGTLSKDFPAVVRLVMGVCFGGALTFVIFAGSELFTGSNLVLTLGVLMSKASKRDLGANWLWTWVGNLLGSALLAIMVIRSGVLAAEPIHGFVLKLVQTKMTISAEQLFWRAVLANWLVCLGVWLAARTKNDIARIVLIWWCMFTFITCGFEHSVANMCGLLLGLLLPHAGFEQITWGGYAYNLALATAGNIVGGAVFVAGMYWLGSPRPAAEPEGEPQIGPLRPQNAAPVRTIDEPAMDMTPSGLAVAGN